MMPLQTLLQKLESARLLIFNSKDAQIAVLLDVSAMNIQASYQAGVPLIRIIKTICLSIHFTHVHTLM